MNQWAFVIAAFAVTLLALAVLLVRSWTAMRAAEGRADSLSNRR